MTRKQRRPGIATLELVFVFPMLLGMSAALFIMGRGIIRKESVSSAARNEAWQKRQDANPGHLLLLKHEPMESEVHVERTKPVNLGVLARGQSLNAESHNSVLGRPWNYDDVRFAPLGQIQTHRIELKQIAKTVPGLAAIIGPIFSVFEWTINPERNFALKGFALTGRIMNIGVRIAGAILKGVAIGLQPALIAVRIAEVAAWASFQWGLARYLGKLGDLIECGIDAFNNLFEASRGRPGKWDSGLVRKLQRSISL